MAVIPMPKKPRGAFNPDRLVSTLLMTQVLHLREAEKLFPPENRWPDYINTIKTEAEAAEYIHYVTTTLHELHRRGRVRSIAAAAETTRKSKARTKSKAKSKTKKRTLAKARIKTR